MDLNNLNLSPALLAALYPSSLVEDEAAPAIVAAAPDSPQPSATPAWKSLGNNQQQILITVSYSGTTYLPDAALNLLTSMLTACKLSLGDVAIVNLQHYDNISGKEIISHFKSKRVLLFGMDPISFGLPVSFPTFQVQTVANTTYLYSPALDDIIDDKLAKSKLWVCLQRIFSI